MIDKEKVIKGLECHRIDNNHRINCIDCPYYVDDDNHIRCVNDLHDDALVLLKEQEKEIKALRLLVEWAEECDFGFDQFSDEYERYKDEIKDMKYIDGMIHVAKRTLEDHGVFEEGR